MSENSGAREKLTDDFSGPRVSVICDLSLLPYPTSPCLPLQFSEELSVVRALSQFPGLPQVDDLTLVLSHLALSFSGCV